MYWISSCLEKPRLEFAYSTLFPLRMTVYIWSCVIWKKPLNVDEMFPHNAATEFTFIPFKDTIKFF